jgi:putative multiple sugar transport system permease protein
MSRIKDLQKNLFGGTTSNARQFGMIFTLVAIVLIFQIWTDGLTLRSDNLIALFQQNSYILILAIGMLMVIVAGHIDLSVGSIAAFTGILVAKAMAEWDLPWPAAIIFGLAIGAVIGAWQGFWVAYIGVPAFIVTLAGMLLFRGGNQFIGNANTIPVPEGFRDIGAGFLPEVGPNTGYNNLTLLLGLAGCVAVVWRELQARRAGTWTPSRPRCGSRSCGWPSWSGCSSSSRCASPAAGSAPASRSPASSWWCWSWHTPSTPATPRAAGTSTPSVATSGQPSCPA